MMEQIRQWGVQRIPDTDNHDFVDTATPFPDTRSLLNDLYPEVIRGADHSAKTKLLSEFCRYLISEFATELKQHHLNSERNLLYVAATQPRERRILSQYGKGFRWP